MADQAITEERQEAQPRAQSRGLIALASVAILAMAFGLVWIQSSKYEPLTVGKIAPEFELPDLVDKGVRLSDFRGKVVFLNFWATWCKPCREEMPSRESVEKGNGRDLLGGRTINIERA